MHVNYVSFLIILIPLQINAKSYLRKVTIFRNKRKKETFYISNIYFIDSGVKKQNCFSC